jgi:predicted DNA binding CopG/RHH family protein
MAREKILRVRLSDSEWEMVEKMASSEGLSIADWMRTQIRILYKQMNTSSHS